MIYIISEEEYYNYMSYLDWNCEITPLQLFELNNEKLIDLYLSLIEQGVSMEKRCLRIVPYYTKGSLDRWKYVILYDE